MIDLQHEQRRIAALRQYGILDTPNEPCFDRIAAMAARIFDVPIALITFVDTDRVWFKSAYGFDQRETPREGTICDRTINFDTIQVVEDTLKDELLACQPAMDGIRFCAAAPLTDLLGYRLGTLCILDEEPRQFDEDDRRTLNDLALLVMDAIQLRHSGRALRAETQKKRRLNDRLADKKRLESLGVLVGGLAHDLNNLLVPVIVNSELIRSGYGNAEEAKELAAEIEMAGDRAAKLCTQLLAYAGKSKSVRKRTSLKQIVDTSIQMLRDSVGHAAVDLRFADNATSLEVDADFTGLSQVFYNIMRNAWDASERCDGTVEVQLYDATPSALPDTDPYIGECDPGKTYAGIQIRDQGNGIEESMIAKIFEPFFTTKKASGTGLGLAASAGIVRTHEGVIFVSSSASGTTFDILIPNGKVAYKVPDRRRTVLVIDEEPIVGRTAATMIEQIGLAPLIAQSADEAQELID